MSALCWCGKRGAVLRHPSQVIACDDCAAVQECHNYKFCLTTGPRWHLSNRNGFCLNCFIIFNNKACGGVPLSFRASCGEDDCCPVCMAGDKDLMLFPAAGCNHWMCVECCRKIIHLDERWWCIDPCIFGCPPCPEGCANPEKGKQCSCLSYESVKRKWRDENPSQYQEWFDQETISINTGFYESGSFYCTNTCPFCKRVI